MNFRAWVIWGAVLSATAGLVLPAVASAPSGADTFQLLASPFTGGDNTGDGGTGAASDLNYYYVGQTFSTNIEIKSGGTDAANIWIDHDTSKVTPSSLTNGTYFPSYAGQSTSAGRVKLTGFRTSGTSSGTGLFGSLNWTMAAPSAAAYGTGTPQTLDINIGSVGATTESNISLGGLDILDAAEDFQLHVWADTVKPFAENPSPANAASSVAVTANYAFDLRDTKNGEGDNSGVGTGVNTATPPGAITADDGGGPVSQTAFDSYSCSGVWGTNLCGVTVNPTSPSGIPGDTRNWEYATTYTMGISGFRDLASSSQDQLGDANGPNVMNPKSFSFTTEADTVAPQIVSETPARTSSGQSPSTNITAVVHDKKAYPGTVSGTGVVSSTCKFNVSSPSISLATYQQGDPEVTVSAVDYGFQYVINPPSDFAQDETVTVSAFDCEDVAGNAMVTDTWTFSTADSDAPFVDQVSPADDTVISPDTSLLFHIKDDGVGVDLSSVAFFVNGVFYSDGGGAGSVTTTGTRISFSSSEDFNGGNYVGDTTGVTGTPADYTFTVDPQANFATSEAVPVLIYTSDSSGNLMDQYAYALAVQQPGGGGGGGGGGGSSVGPLPGRSISDLQAVQVDEHSVLVSWRASVESTARVVYDTHSPSYLMSAPRYGYANTTVSDGAFREYNAVIVSGLTPGQLYVFRPVANDRTGAEFVGSEVSMSPRPLFVVGDCPAVPTAPPVLCPEIPATPTAGQCPAPTIVYVPVPSPVTHVPSPVPPIGATVLPGGGATGIAITDIQKGADAYIFAGKAMPGTVTIIIH